jgi:uncharacterized protein (UPF0335 family)
MNQAIGKNTIAGELLRGFVERVESINEKMEDLRDDKRVIMAEAQQADILPAGINYIVKQRKMKPSERAEDDSLKSMYLHAMGMEPNNPLFRMVGLMKVDITSRESVIEAMKDFVPAGGSIEVDAGGGPKVRLTRDKEGNVAVTEVTEKPVGEPTSTKSGSKPPKPPVPDVDANGAEQLGRDAFKHDQPIIANPFPYGDPRRARWDAGWRDESGGDGMGD